MKLKPLEPGDSVRVKYTVQVNGRDSVIYLDGKLLRQDDSGTFPSSFWLVEYQLSPEFNSPKYTDWWLEGAITSKHYLPTTDAELFEKAEKIAASDYHGVVYWDDYYFDEVDDFLEWWEDQDFEHKPKFVWTCDANPVKLRIDLVDYVSEALEDSGYEGISERSQFHPLYDELRILQDKLVAIAAKEIVLVPNYKKAIAL